MSYHQMYRRTTLGNTLQEALEEMIALKLIQPKTAVKVIQKFDQCISLALARRVKNRLLVRGHLNAYRFCDNVWTFVMNDVEIKDASTVLVVDKMKIVACEGKTVKPTGAASDAGRDGRGGPEGSNSPEHCSSGGGLGRSGVGDPDDAEKSYQSADELTD